MTRKSTLLLVDDHLLMRKGLRVLLEQEADFTVIGEAGNGQEAIEQVRQLKPDIVVMDINMPDLNGIDATRQILSESPDCKVLALSMHSGKQFVEEMLSAGAAGYLLKESAPEELVAALNAFQAGKGYLSADITEIVLSKFRNESPDKKSNGNKNLIKQISSKLILPSLPAKLVHREALISQLNKGVEKKLTLVTAPAGYGKSTLVSDWLRQCNHPYSWLSVAQEDNDLDQFLTCLLAAVRKLFPNAGEHLQPHLEVANLPPVSILAGALLADLEKISSPFVLAVDNLHLTREKAIHDLLSQVLLSPIRVMHLVLIDRKNPFLPLSTLRANNDLNEIRMKDLRFSPQEITTFLEQALGQSVAPETTASWTERTEGWVTGLQLAIHTLEGSDTQESTTYKDPAGVNWRNLLTNREYEILLLLHERLRDKEIADRLCVSTETVKSHLKNIYGKLYASDRRDAIVKAAELGFIPQE